MPPVPLQLHPGVSTHYPRWMIQNVYSAILSGFYSKQTEKKTQYSQNTASACLLESKPCRGVGLEAECMLGMFHVYLFIYCIFNALDTTL